MQMVGMGECKIFRGEGDHLVALGLGSCIGLCAFDPVNMVGGMVHVVLPESHGAQDFPGKYADSAVKFLIEKMSGLGADSKKINFAMAGGAQLFKGSDNGKMLNVGPRNAEAVLAMLASLRITPAAVDVGGVCGRTVTLTDNGDMRVKTLGKDDKVLINLKTCNILTMVQYKQTMDSSQFKRAA